MRSNKVDYIELLTYIEPKSITLPCELAIVCQINYHHGEAATYHHPATADHIEFVKINVDDLPDDYNGVWRIGDEVDWFYHLETEDLRYIEEWCRNIAYSGNSWLKF